MTIDVVNRFTFMAFARAISSFLNSLVVIPGKIKKIEKLLNWEEKYKIK